MQTFQIGEYIILKGTKASEPKFRETLSELIISKFGKSPYSADVVTAILSFCKLFYISEFEKIIRKEKSFSFFKEIVWLHEQAANLRHSEHFKTLPDGIEKSYIAGYRRILKIIIEQGCCTDMFSGEKRDLKFKERIDPILNDLLFLGEMLLSISESIAEQAMIEDAIDVTFDKNNLYVLSRRHYYEFIYSQIGRKQENNNLEYIVDDNGSIDYKKAIQESFDIDYEKFWETIILVMEHFKLDYCDCISAEQSGFLKDIQNYTKSSFDLIEKFLSGMTLTKENQLSLSDLLEKPNSLNKYLYRPFLLWTIDEKKYYIFGLASLLEAEESLYLNAIPWQKMPPEWEDIKAFKEYVNKKHNEHDKWLEDNIEYSIKKAGLLYQRNVVKLETKKQSYSLKVEHIGEIDFIIVSPNTKKIFIAECKHLLGRYDMVNQKNDYDNFIIDKKNKKSFNTRLKLKVHWLTENKAILEEHLQSRFNEPVHWQQDYVIEGIFFVNTPTFYMYNSELRIYTFEKALDVITGQHIDPTFSYTIEEEDRYIYYLIKYPYFKLPKMMYYKDDDGKHKVDKYGFPVKD